LGKKSREKVLARFSIDHVLKQYENLYRTLA